MKEREKLFYQEPQIEVTEFSKEDSIATSGNHLGAGLWDNIWGGGDGL